MWYKYLMKKAMRISVLILLTVLSLLRNAAWKDDGTLWNDATSKGPGKARGYNEVGLHAIETGNYAEALYAFTKTIQKNPYQQEAYINIGLAYEGLKKTDLAVQAYEKAIALAPSDPVAYYNLGILFYNTGKDRDTAFGLLLKARDLNPQEPDVHEYLGFIYRERGDHPAAQKEFSLYQSLK